MGPREINYPPKFYRSVENWHISPMIGKGLKKETALEGETNSLLLVANVEELSERYECPL